MTSTGDHEPRNAPLEPGRKHVLVAGATGRLGVLVEVLLERTRFAP
jgi:hypothetical protein